MKNMAIVFLVIVLTFALTGNALAANLVYLDIMTDGTVETSGSNIGALNSEKDLKINILSGGTMLGGKYKIGAEYGVGTIGEGSDESDVTLWSVKGGYRVYDALATKLDVLIAPLNIDTESNTLDSKLETLLAGLDVTQFFSPKMFLTGSLAYSINGSYDSSLGNDDSVPVSMMRVKFHYLVSDKVALEAGFTALKYTAHYTAFGGGDLDYNLGGLSLGVMYTF